MVFCLLGAPGVSAQSMLEYGTLLTATGAAGAAAGEDEEKDKDNKDKGPSRAGGLIGSTASRLYEEGMQTAAERGGALLGQAGRGVPAPAAAEEKAAAARPVVSDAAAQPAAQTAPGPEEAAAGPVKVTLKNGRVVEGLLVEQTAEHVRIESAGVVVTFFMEEVSGVQTAAETP